MDQGVWADEMARRIAEADAEMDAMAQELVERYEELTVLYDLSASLGRVFDIDQQRTIAAERAARAIRGATCDVLLDPDRGSGGVKVQPGPPASLTVPVEAIGADGKPEVFGALTLSRAETFDAGAVKLATAVARQLGTALMTGRMAESLRDAALLQHEVEVASTIQHQLLPAEPPHVPGLDLAGECLPASRVGGDYYDFVVDATGSVSILVADVAGHSVSSGLLMAMARSVLRRDAGDGWPPDAVLDAANRTMFVDLERAGLFITAYAARYEPETRALTFTNGAHNPALLWRARQQRLDVLDSDGMAIGMLPDPTYERGRTTIARGDVLLVYTDGVTEARDAGGELFGEDRLHRLVGEVAGGNAAEIVAAVTAAVAGHAGGEPQQDDVTVVAAKVAG